MSSDFSWERFRRLPVIGILRGFEPQVTRELVEIVVAEGLTSIEVTMDSPGVLDELRAIAARHGGAVNVGAGTVVSVADVERALDAGAGFVVTPVVVPEVIAACRARAVPVFPGAFTPTEVFQAWRAGADMVKLFPASALGPGYLRAIKAPLSQVKLLATGGVGLDNLDAYRSAGADGFGVGSPLFDAKRVQARDWDWLRRQVRGFVQAFEE